MNEVMNRVSALRTLMGEWGWNAAVIVGEDPHNSEYTPLRWCQREFISGFTGSAGVVVITMEHAGLWVDSRYHIQAARELAGSGIELHRMVSAEDAGWIDWIAANLQPGCVVGVDGLCMSLSVASRLKASLEPKSGSVVSKPDFISAIWTDRPSLPQDAVWMHQTEFSGRTTSDKLAWMRGVMSQNGCAYALVTTLDQIAWLLNIRSNDIEYCPVVISFAVIAPDGVELFAETSKFSGEVIASLAADGVSVHPYGDISAYISSLKPVGKIMIDPQSLNFELGECVAGVFAENGIVRCASPIDLEKSKKNPVEVEGFRKAYLMDGIAQTRFYHWLDEALASGQHISEADASDKLHEFRAMCPDFLDESFETISAYQENSALPHYSTVRGYDDVLRPQGLYLNDSGAHYKYGTTDITRTVPLGPLTEMEREDYTIDMKAMIDLSMAIFPVGTPGCRLDAVARRPLWQTMRNFGHGTGHGVGNVLSVHEGPQSIRQNLKDQPLEPGMITSNEPGIYREGYHGIRHENMLLCVPAGGNEFGSWLKFETLTLTWLETSALIPELLDDDETAWLNSFNLNVYETLKPYLCESDAAWLYARTRPLLA